MNDIVICFDMDGTIADLYQVPDWLKKLRSEDATPYEDAKPMVDMEKLGEVCALLQKAGAEIRIITSLSKEASPAYKDAIRKAKKAWLDKWGFIADHFHGVDYKTSKNEVMRREMKKHPGTKAVLIDDESRHRDKWQWGEAVDPTETNIIDYLLSLLPEELK